MDRITQLTDKELVVRTEKLRGEEKALLHTLLLHFGEIDSRKLYRDEGFSSMFVYLTGGFGYSESSAYKRITAARALRAHPELLKAFSSGELTFSALVELAKGVDEENVGELLRKCRGQSKAEVAEVVAAVQAPEVPRRRKERVRVVRAKSSDGRAPLFEDSTFPGKVDEPELEPQPQYEVSFQADEEFMKLYREVKSLAGGSSMKEVVGKALKDYVKRNSAKEKQKRRERRKARIEKATPTKRTRHIPAPVRDEVFLRDKGQCAFTSDTGNQCCATEHLEIDHIVPFSLGGSHDPENLRLLCRAHNQLEAERVFGRDAIEQCYGT